MKQQPISLRRRHLVIAGIAGAAVPVVVRASPAETEALADARVAGDLVVSGRVVDGAGRALPDALVAAAPGVSTMTDGDGRFLLRMHVPRRRRVEVRVSHAAHPARTARLRQFERDETGILRTTVGLSVA